MQFLNKNIAVFTKRSNKLRTPCMHFLIHLPEYHKKIWRLFCIFHDDHIVSIYSTRIEYFSISWKFTAIQITIDSRMLEILTRSSAFKIEIAIIFRAALSIAMQDDRRKIFRFGMTSRCPSDASCVLQCFFACRFARLDVDHERHANIIYNERSIVG